jgi:hypothetical protein
MSLEMVQQKLDRSSYLSIGQVCADLGTIWNNAKRCKLNTLHTAHCNLTREQTT